MRSLDTRRPTIRGFIVNVHSPTSPSRKVTNWLRLMPWNSICMIVAKTLPSFHCDVTRMPRESCYPRFMATIAHAAAGLVIGRVHSSTTRSPLVGSFIVFSALAILPDLDVVVGPSLAAAHPALAHRGVGHSLGVAVAVGLIAWLVSRGTRRWPPLETALAAAIACASNGLLDLFSSGGEGVAVLWPLLDTRWIGLWRPIPDAPFESLLTTAHGFRCLVLETAGCLPAIFWALARRSSRRARASVADDLPLAPGVAKTLGDAAGPNARVQEAI